MAGSNRTEQINIRTAVAERELIDRAASMCGKSRSEFMIESSIQAAKNELLNRTYITLDDRAYDRLISALEEPPAPSEHLLRLLRTPAPWE